MTLVDGGVFTNLDLGDAINRCKELVENDEDIIVDMILIFSEPEKIKEWTLEEAQTKNAYDFVKRKEYFQDIYYWYFDDYLRIMEGFPHINFRYIVSPTKPIETDYMAISNTYEG